MTEQQVKYPTSALEEMNPDPADATYVRLLAALCAAHRALANQLALKVYAYGFLRR
ncbi:MAG: hypothetical protein ILO10_06115 [Kiritimatiellae bacterium]|nr:hypothetical protein [Kiritimatiellia bacterium]